MSKKNILICGATGFLGRNIAERFAKREDFEVYATYFNSKPYENEKIGWIYADLRNSKTVEEIVCGKDIIIQMAAVTSGAKDIITRPYIHVTDNALMNSLLLRAAFENNVGYFIFPSCTVMYDSNELPVKEEDFDEKKISKKYFGVAHTKVYIEKMCEFFAGLGRTKHTVMRHSNIYGPHDKFDLEKSHVFGATVNKIVNTSTPCCEGKRTDTIDVWGDGSEKRDLLYVDDLVNFIELAINKQEKPFGLYNVGSGKAVSVSELIKRMMDYTGSQTKINYDTSKPTIKTELALNITRAKAEFGWEPRISLDEGIEKTINWYRKNIFS